VSFTTIRVAVGRVVLVAGVLVLLFIPYLLWGTGLMTAHSQSVLRSQFRAEQERAGSHPAPLPHAKGHSTQPVVAPTIAVPPIGSAVGTIDIPTIGLDMVVVEGTDEIRLQQGPGHYPGTPLPGEAGNVAIAGHRTTYLHPFYNLNELVAGDPIVITTTQGIFRYDVIGSQVVSPDDVAVVAPTATPELTLTTCNPRFSARQRLVVHAALVASSLAHTATTTPTTTPPVSPTTTVAPGGGSGVGVGSAASPRNWWAAIGWGLVVAVIITAVWVAARRTRRGVRALVLVVGLIAWLGLVFVFFQSLAPLLPASF
jgi:sortase A